MGSSEEGGGGGGLSILGETRESSEMSCNALVVRSIELTSGAPAVHDLPHPFCGHGTRASKRRLRTFCQHAAISLRA